MQRLLFLLLFWATNLFAWSNTQWNSGVALSSVAGGGFVFNFPDGSGHVNSIIQKHGAIPFRKTIAFTCQIKTLSGNPKFVSLDDAPSPPSLKPNCRVLLQRKGDNWSCVGGKEHYRWWSTGAMCVFLAPADGLDKIYTVKLVPANWSNCWGKMASQYPNEFKAALANLDNIQLVFGGGNSFSHGVRVSNGKARFSLVSLKIL